MKENKKYTIQIIGDIALLKFKENISEEEKIKIAKSIKEKMPRIKTICELKRIEGEFRNPIAKVLIGNDTITIHKEHGILYKLDVLNIMFSKGNLYERKRIINAIKENETIVDMFAGIGYFSLGIAKYSKARIVYAIEKNPVAYNFLKENITLNKLENKIIAILGDCREIARKKELQGIANRVIMGYLKNTEDFLSSAFLFLKDQGIIHFHNTYKKEELWNLPIKILEERAKYFGFELEEIISKRIVKSYAPRVFHVVLDARFRRNRYQNG